jgi:outer membrane protein OmpA-like peptidoglycan-associated protein
MAIEQLKKSSKKDKQIFLITDGQENSSIVSTNVDSIIQYANKNKIVINTIAYGDYVKRDYLTKISNKTGGYFEHIYTTEELKHVFSHSYQRVNNNFQLTFRPCMYSDTLTVETTIKVGKVKYKNTKMFTYEMNIGAIIDFQVLFEKDKSNIENIYLPQINELISYLMLHPSIEIELRGHTDSDGDNGYNLKLSQKRADAIKNYMVKNGISANRLTAVGYGEKEPIYVEDSEENMYLNRRTEAKILKF